MAEKKKDIDEIYVPFSLEELLTFDHEEILARGREYLGEDWTPSWMLEQQKKEPSHA